MERCSNEVTRPMTARLDKYMGLYAEEEIKLL
jgi:hypothetical protein